MTGAFPAAPRIVLAHAAYRLADAYRDRGAPFPHVEVRSAEALAAEIGACDVLVVSGLWRHALLDQAPRLRLIQSISAGTDQFDRALLSRRGIRLASAQGANERAVAEHAMALMLSLARQLHLARDHQAEARWRSMIADPAQRERELGGLTLVVYGLGRIGSRLAALARAFGMRVIGVRRRPPDPGEAADQVVGPDRFHDVLAEADVVALTCPLTPETEGLMGPAAFAAMKPGAWLVNVARGRVVDEAALIETLRDGRLAAAGLDCFHEEPLPATSPLWAMPNVIVTPHAAGETQAHEARVIDLLLDNIARLQRGDDELTNGVV